jgi:sulfotransferase famil protein
VLLDIRVIGAVDGVNSRPGSVQDQGQRSCWDRTIPPPVLRFDSPIRTRDSGLLVACPRRGRGFQQNCPSGGASGSAVKAGHRFLFVHIYKNAGISITTALMPYAATPSQLRVERALGRLGLSYLDPRVIRRSSSARDWISNGVNNLYERLTFLPDHPQPAPAHATASDIIAKIGREAFDACFSFGIVRNPWAWQVSMYQFAIESVLDLPALAVHARRLNSVRQTYSKFESFDDYIHWRCTEDVNLQKDFLFSRSGEQLVDFVGRFERLDSDFRTICERIGIPATLPRLNESAKGKPYQDYYTPETIELVRRAFTPDIEAFGYDFDSSRL